MKRLRCAADLGRNRGHRSPARMVLAGVIQNHPNRAVPDLRRKLVRRLACHGSILSGVGASGKPGAVHYPTGSSLLGDGVRVLIHTMKKITKMAGTAGTKLRDCSRSVKLRVLDIARAARSRAKQGSEKLKFAYSQLLNSAGRVFGQAKQFSAQIAAGVKQANNAMGQLKLDRLRNQIDEMVPPVKQVTKQTRARIYRGDARSQGKLLSVFGPSTEVIRKGKAGKTNEFGKMVKLQEAENQIVIDFEVYGQRPNDCDLLVPAIDVHQATLGRAPYSSLPTRPSILILLRIDGHL